MKSRSRLVSLISRIASLSSAAWPAPPPALLAELAPLLGAWSGHVSLACWHLETDERWALGDAPMPAASLIKVPLAVAALRALDLEEAVPVPPLPADDEAEFDNLGLAPAGTRFTWRKIVDRMITESDNAATNVLIDRLGLDAVEALASELGLAHTALRRRMLDQDARDAGRENHTTACEMASLLAALRRGALLPPGPTQELLGLLGQQRSREKLANGLPAGTPFAHKTGELPGFRHDAGIVGGKRAWVVAALVAAAPDGSRDAEADLLLGRLMAVVHGWLARQDARASEAIAWLGATRRALVPDPRLAHDDLAVGWAHGRLVLSGATTVAGRLEAPAALGLEVRARHLGGRPGVVHVPCLQLRRGPGHAHELVSQARLGDPLVLLEEEAEADWVLLRAPDGYVAWGKRNNVTPGDAFLPGWVVAAPIATGAADDGAVVQLSAGSRLARRDDGRFAMPDGRTVALADADVRPAGQVGSPEQLLALAMRFRGLPYLWGGTSGWGIDCSGLVQLCHHVLGVALPRDADQQQAALPPVADPAALLPGDPVFFPGHVGLWLGGGEFVHAAAKPGCVVVNSFDPASPRYDAELRASFTGGGRTPLRVAAAAGP
jgi:beta-lactamase class A